MGAKREGRSWLVWLGVGAGPILSAVTILLYVIILDIDIPSVKPRPSLENAAAAIVYFDHSGNILASIFLAFVLLQEEYNLLAFWLVWCCVHVLAVIILIILSVYTVLPYIPGRIVLHAGSLLIAVVASYIMLTVYRNGGLEGGILGSGGRREDDSDWRTGLQKPPPGPRKPALKGETNFISGETNFL
ncbi:uncharacterized protein LOC111709466 isoform X2 [Eurytemora carolleeae]|uniref:uncharacterized protein LOC111709466 isoform X2 n=1 Tax=Eurytemora carolleeae TaxID=1294199 RepID=UPI000C776AE9|nr:uncharacterized protein LOC111709466 isoform X2 [Eurytemora carolleeae]|eukprot:XP_023338896.1 uncharacterized protein LOC111709466 isoform X2 [Eurytemora affinis]